MAEEPQQEQVAPEFASSRKVKMLMVNPVDFMSLFTNGLRVRAGWKMISGLPADALLVSVAYEPARGAIMLVVESAEYDEVPRGELPPRVLVGIDIRDKHFQKPEKKKK